MHRDKIRTCIIGAGRAGLIHIKNFATGISRSNLVAIADPSKEAVEKACTQFGIRKHYLDYRQAIEDKGIDAVVVATPTAFHRDVVVAAANAGKHVFCEKSMAMNTSECDEMIQAAEKSGVKLQIGFMRRFARAFLAAKERIEQGEIGDVVLVKSLTYGPSIPQSWMYDISKSNGPLAEVNSHDIDTLRWFTGSEFERVYAVAGNYRCPQARKDFPDFYDNVLLNAYFKNGMQGGISGAQGVQYGYDARVEVLGTKGIIFIGGLNDSTVVSCNMDKGMVQPIVKSWTSLFEDAYLAEGNDFIDCIINDRLPRANGFDGKMAVEVVDAGNRSIREKQPIRLGAGEI